MRKPDILDYISEDVLDSVCKNLKNGDSVIIYETEEIKIKLKNRSGKIIKIFFIYGSIEFADCIKELAKIQG